METNYNQKYASFYSNLIYFILWCFITYIILSADITFKFNDYSIDSNSKLLGAIRIIILFACGWHSADYLRDAWRLRPWKKQLDRPG